MSTGEAEDVRVVLGLTAEGTPKRRLRWLKRAAIVAAVAAIAVVGHAVWRRGASDGLPRFTTVHPERTDLRVTVTTTGNLRGSSIVSVGAEVTGKVLRVAVDYNDQVTKGQLLAELDPEQLRATADEASAQVLAAQASIETAKATQLEARQARARADEQSAQGLVSRKDLESAVAVSARADAAVASAMANARLAQATLKSAQSRLEKTKIFAPIDGVVLSRSVEPGQTVTSGFTTPELFTVAADLRKLALEVSVDEADVGRVREGLDATFTVDAWPTRSFHSRVVGVHNDPTTSNNVVTYLAVLSVDNGDRALRPGMTATATIVSETIRDALVVPNAALRWVPPAKPRAGFGPPEAGSTVSSSSEQKRVYVLRRGEAVLVHVQTGASDGRSTQILSNELSPSDEVITDAVTAR